MRTSSVVIKVVVFAGVLAVSGASAAAAAGGLPEPAQNAVAGAADHVGLHLPKVGEDATSTSLPASTPLVATTLPVGDAPANGTTELPTTTTAINTSADGRKGDDSPSGTTSPPMTASTTDDHRQGAKRGTDATAEDGIHQHRGRGSDDPTTTTPSVATTTSTTLDDDRGEHDSANDDSGRGSSSGKGKSSKSSESSSGTTKTFPDEIVSLKNH